MYLGEYTVWTETVKDFIVWLFCVWFCLCKVEN